jgi:outer membrane lipoprotein-sorting protein
MRSGAIALALVVLLFLSGCATMGGWVGIASEESVETIRELMEILQRYLEEGE